MFLQKERIAILILHKSFSDGNLNEIEKQKLNSLRFRESRCYTAEYLK